MKPERCQVDPAPLEVVVAVIEREGRYLIAQRLPGDSFGGRWEFPGGKLKAGETMEAALVREIREELGIAISVGEKLKVIGHRYPNREIRLHCFHCRLLEGEPKALECADWRWVDSSELAQFQFPPASGPILEAIVQGARLKPGTPPA